MASVGSDVSAPLKPPYFAGSVAWDDASPAQHEALPFAHRPENPARGREQEERRNRLVFLAAAKIDQGRDSLLAGGAAHDCRAERPCNPARGVAEEGNRPTGDPQSGPFGWNGRSRNRC